MDDIYEQMLFEAGVISSVSKKQQQQQQHINECCGSIQYYSSCNQCGKVLEHYQYDWSREGENVTYPGQVYRNPGYHITAHRPYKISSHFRAHFRQYINNWSFDRADQDYTNLVEYIKTNLDINDVNAYILAKQYIKACKNPRLYKLAWSALYDAGGISPQFNSQELELVFKQFKAIQNFFIDNFDKGRYHNICSVFTVLYFLLTVIGKKPYYNFPHVKNHDALVRGDEFINSYRSFFIEQNSYKPC